MKNTSKQKKPAKKISRKEALKKTGIVALTASSIFFLDTKKASSTSSKPARPGYNR